MENVTVWKIKKDDGTIIHNHIEDDWVDGEKPRPIKESYGNHKAWKEFNWIKYYAELKDGKIKYAD
ncbi:hypothetical protein WKH56_20435 [Priestia sp. SB1]|uniref:hypothetical protein n=1 Tax=Priestia sp. SB1 TaxID=3132359 RepID=UPI00317B2E16